ncbi:hypothetical protein N482_17325 [Pseudoalteromonas luteoviolacea NCIMB 1942]|uniref:Uncharacterized protein n=1 Tax=Pseudoalteromonas luteoviolacea NCIMB 1942 TaxID=1365253 RepID=A0A166ZC87_9GAMM|nr:hypothetical protein N482_17325 [Pseudoalteromonas luteoviolacea NCIMB 1942]
MQSRHIEEGEDKLYPFASEFKSAGTKCIEIAQKGDRKSRTATLDITFAPVTLNYVGCAERNNPDRGLNWYLLTSDPVTSKEEVLDIIRYYEYRW